MSLSRLSTSERKTSTIDRPLLSTNRSKNSVVSTSKIVDPIEKRLLHVRIYTLSNRIPRRVTFAEPTLVFDEFLYLGGLRSLRDQNRLNHLNITHILSVVWIRPRKDLLPPNIKHLFIKADDCCSFDMTPYFEQACQFIQEARESNGCVLVHCACGVSRSTTLCCAYLIKHHSMSLEQALTQIRSKRSIVQPNSGFLRQLIHFNDKVDSEKTNIDTITDKLENI